MRQITRDIVQAFCNGNKMQISNSYTDGTSLFLHGNKIAEHTPNGLRITNCGWQSNTTKERLNALPNVHINQKNFIWFLNGKEWNGKPATYCQEHGWIMEGELDLCDIPF